MTDLTKITTPFGLLDAETQEALRAHGGPYERYSSEGWVMSQYPAWYVEDAYRVKPQPPKPREWWINYDTNFVLRYQPDDDGSFNRKGYVHVREVLE